MLKRMLFFVYGIVAYVTFLGSFLYAIAFVGGFLVSRRLDGPQETSLVAALAVDCGLLAIFAVQHSVMARRWFKERWTQIVPWAIERSTFVLFASLALSLVIWQWRPIGITIWSVEHPGVRAVLWTLFAMGWTTVLIVTLLINHFDLFGLRQVWLPVVGKPYTPVSFRTPALYRFVRHPLYLGFLLAFWMTPTMTLAHLVFAIATTAYIVLAIQFEEHDLIREHGAAYEEYRRQVPMLLPGRARLPKTSSSDVGSPTRVATGVVLLIGLTVGAPWGQDDGYVHAQAALHHESSVDQGNAGGALVKAVRAATERFRDVAVAEAEGYFLQFGCVTGPDAGAMGMHYVNGPLVMDGQLDVNRPEIVIYEPLPNGTLQLIGADYLVLADAWNATHAGPPELMGQLFHLFEAPNRFGLPAFYTLHVWAWKENPKGTFVNWHPTVSCDGFSGNSH